MTIFLCTILHAFTHALATLLVPLYILIRKDMQLSGVQMASLLVTIYGVTYCLLSFPSGILADGMNRKRLLGWGLIGNALAVVLMGLTRRYEWLVVLAVFAGFAGTLFHPAMATLAPAHYPKSPAMAIGLVGMGSGIGFFAGPQFAGWRAQSAAWQWGTIADWQKPCIEMGLAGIVVGILFLLLATEVNRPVDEATARRATRTPLPKGMKRKLLALSMVLGCRDFAGVASLTLASLYLQKAHNKTPKETGFIIGAMMLFSVVLNPLAVWLTAGRRRLPWLSIILVLGGLTVSTAAWWPVAWVLLGLTIFQCFQLSSYAVSDAAMLERVSSEIRGRVIGVFLSLAGTLAALSPWVMGYWVDEMGTASRDPASYRAPFIVLGALMVVSAASTPIIARLGYVGGPKIDPLTEVGPRTLEPVG